MTEKPTPRVTAINRPFWDGCNQGRLMLQRCAAPECRKHVFYPRVCCPHCGHGALDWVEASGRGRILTYTEIHRPGHDAFLGEVPFLFIAVGLDEDPTIHSRLAGPAADNAGLIGRPVKVVFHQSTERQKLPFFALAG